MNERVTQEMGYLKSETVRVENLITIKYRLSDKFIEDEFIHKGNIYDKHQSFSFSPIWLGNNQRKIIWSAPQINIVHFDLNYVYDPITNSHIQSNFTSNELFDLDWHNIRIFMERFAESAKVALSANLKTIIVDDVDTADEEELQAAANIYDELHKDPATQSVETLLS